MMDKKSYRKKDINAEVTEQKRLNRSRARVVFYICLFVILITVFAAFFVFIFLKINEVTVNGNSRYNEEEVLGTVGIEKGENITEVVFGDHAAAIPRKLPYIAEASVRVVLPDKVIIEVRETEAAMFTVINGDCFLLSSELKVLERKNAADMIGSSLPEVKVGIVSRCVVGETCMFADSREGDALLTLYSEFAKNGVADKIRSMNIESRFDISVEYDNRFSVYFGDMNYADIKVQLLIETIKQFDPGDKGRIDVSSHKESAVLLE